MDSDNSNYLKIKSFDSLTALIDSLQGQPVTEEIRNAIIKAWSKIHGYGGEKTGVPSFTPYHKIMVAVSGGADSDIVVDLIERIGHPFSEVHYVFYDTGLEFQATKEHLVYLEKKYGIIIEREKAEIPIPLGIKKYGCPFLSKRVSDYIHRLQKHGFKWEDKPFDELYKEYPKCKTALNWWCNNFGENSRMNIKQNKWLKEFMIENPPDFLISDGCCKGAKKLTAHRVE